MRNTLTDSYAESVLQGTDDWSIRSPQWPATGRSNISSAPVGHYETIRQLGRGGMGEVWLARDTRLGRLVALKFLTQQRGKDTQRFLIEARATANVSHDTIVRLYDIAEHNDMPYMVLEYVRGQSLGMWLKQRADRSRAAHIEAGYPYDQWRPPGVAPGRVVELMLPVVRALVCAHKAGIVHRDLKPSNVMLSDDGAVKVLDFSIAKLLSATEVPRTAVAEQPVAFADTQTRGPVGTATHMAPEQWLGQPIDHRVDLWAVGILFYELLTGLHPLASPNPLIPLRHSQLQSVADLDVPMPRIREILPGLGKLGATIDRCLVKRKEDRLGSASDLLAELEALGRPGRLASGSAGDDADEHNPYTGLAAFQEHDADRFFGRDRAIRQILTRISDQPLVTVVGPSGAGKSSFIRAGVIPALKRDDAWESFVVRPGPRPMAALGELLLQHSWHSSSDGHHTDDSSANRRQVSGNTASGELLGAAERDDLIARLGEEPGYLGTMLRARARRKREHIVLFVDQFEEIYTLADAQERNQFLACLAGAADELSSPLRLVVALRADFLDRVTNDPTGASQCITEHLVPLWPMGRDNLRRALLAPAEAAEYRFENESLVTDMLDALQQMASPLPMLQFTAARLWELRDRQRRLLTAASYHRLGGMVGALASHADAVISNLTAAERRCVRGIVTRLVTPDRTRAVVSMNELCASAGAQKDTERVLQRLIEARLLVVERNSDDEGTVELVHESLIAQWPTLARWLDEDQENVEFLARVRYAAREWQSSGRSEGLLWRDQAGRDAQCWYERYTGDLAPVEAAYLEAVIGLAKRTARRRRSMVTAALAMSIVIASAMAYLAIRANDAAALAASQAAKARDYAAQKACEALRARNVSRVAAVEAYRDDPTARLALLRGVEPGELLPRWSGLARQALHEGVARSILFHATYVNTADFSPDGSRVVTASKDSMVRVWNADGSGTPLLLRGHEAEVIVVAYSPDGTRIASTSFDRTVRLWNADGSGMPVVFRGPTDRVTAVDFSPDGTRIAAGTWDNEIWVWNADGSGTPWILRGAGHRVDFSPDGERIASLYAKDGASVVRIWRLDSTAPATVMNFAGEAMDMRFSPDGSRIVLAVDKSVLVRRADGSGEPLVLNGHRELVASVGFSPDGERIVSSSWDKTIRLWNADGSGVARVLRGHHNMVSGAAFSRDGTHVVSSSRDHTARVWNMDNAGAPLILRGHKQAAFAAAFSPDGSRILSTEWDNIIRVRNADGTGTPLILRGHDNYVEQAAFSHDGTRIVSGSWDKTVRVWSSDNSSPPVVMRGHEDRITWVEFSPDDSRVVSGSKDRTVRIWNADGTGAPLVLRGHVKSIRAVSFSPDGTRVVSGSADQTVRVWNADGSGEPLVLRGHAQKVYQVSFSPDGTRIVSASKDKTVRVWNADGSGLPVVLRGHEDVVKAALFSPDGRQIVSASNDKTIRIWNADGSGSPIVLIGHEGRVNSVQYSRDGTRIVSSSDDNTVRVWSDFQPLTPQSPRLWTATSYCPSAELGQTLLGLTASMAQADFARCSRRVDEYRLRSR